MTKKILTKSITKALILLISIYLIIPPIFFIGSTFFDQFSKPEPLLEIGRTIGQGNFICQYKDNAEGYCDFGQLSRQIIFGVLFSIPLAIYLGIYILQNNFTMDFSSSSIIFLNLNLLIFSILIFICNFYYSHKKQKSEIKKS